jgi:hypothetical protein
MRRMTAVSPYPHWHYFDAYRPGYLRAIYRADGIPLPWGNMRMVTEPCRQWSVFRTLGQSRGAKPQAQISLLRDGERSGLYADVSLRTKDAAGNPHVICVGVDLVPALANQGLDPDAIIAAAASGCAARGGAAPASDEVADALTRVAAVLNIGWITDALEQPVEKICPRSTACPRSKPCPNATAIPKRVSWAHELREQIRRGARRRG